jgi:hypothetical protein
MLAFRNEVLSYGSCSKESGTSFNQLKIDLLVFLMRSIADFDC